MKSPFHIQIFLSCLLVFTISTRGKSQDSLSYERNDRLHYFAPAILLTSGLLWNEESRKNSFQKSIRNQIGVPDKRWDDFTQHLPILFLYVSDVAYGFSIHEVKQHTKHLLVSQLATLGITYALKRGFNTARPNGGSKSFPSGHTSYAFAGATVLFHAYKDQNKWVAYSGFLPAAFTGVYRIVRDKHWVSDVLVGAGIGVLIPSLLSEFAWFGADHKRSENDSVSYQFGISPAGISLSLTF